jgi:hypothetical protein
VLDAELGAFEDKFDAWAGEESTTDQITKGMKNNRPPLPGGRPPMAGMRSAAVRKKPDTVRANYDSEGENPESEMTAELIKI